MRRRCAIALSAVPAALKSAAYALGKHHQAAYEPGAPLPVPLVRSATLGLMVPAPALSVVEWRICDWIEVGSHTCFVADRLSETFQAAGEQLAHVSALLAKYVAASGKPPLQPV